MAFVGMKVVVLVDNTCLNYGSSLDCIKANHKLFDYVQNSHKYHLILHILLLAIEGTCWLGA